MNFSTASFMNEWLINFTVEIFSSALFRLSLDVVEEIGVGIRIIFSEFYKL